MRNTPPPAIIDCARVLLYAFVDDIEYQRWASLFVDGNPLEHVPNLAICANLANDQELLLFHCDFEWKVLAATSAVSLETIKERIEKNHPEINTRWVDLNTSIEEALAYYDEHIRGEKCSFCGKRAFELENWIQKPNAIICKGCIADFYNLLFKT